MIIRNVKIYTAERRFAAGAVRTDGDRIAEIMLDGADEAGRGEKRRASDIPDAADGTDSVPGCQDEVIDGRGCYCLPGMIDLHFHGCMGHDVCDGTMEALGAIAAFEASIGVTAICPATMTLPRQQLEAILKTAAKFRKRQREQGCVRGADLVGINMEGPFISRVKKGAQDMRHIIPCDAEVFRSFQRAADGLVKFIGIAPEEGDAETFLRAVKDEVAVSLAHTNADYETAKKAFDRGAGHAVHLYNAMPAFSHREPGVIGAVFDSPHVDAELICDGIHIHPAVVRATFAMLGPDRIILISDSMRAAGMTDGQYTLGGLDVTVRGRRAVLTQGGALAGSVTTLPDCVRTVVREMGIPLEQAVAAATMNPARSLGIEQDYGSIEPGKKADLVLWDQELRLQKVMKDGSFLL